MDTHPHLLFRHNDSVFALDALAVREMINLPELTALEQMPDFLAGVINLRGSVVPVMDLNLRFGRSRRHRRLGDNVIVVESDRTLVGIIVDEVLDVRNVHALQIEPTPSCGQPKDVESRFISGVARLDPDLVMVLHLENLIRLPHEPSVMISGLSDGEPVRATELPELRTDTSEEGAIFRERARSLTHPIETQETRGLMPLAVVGLSREYFGVDLAIVREFADLRDAAPVPCCPPHILGQMNLRGDLLTVVDIRASLKMQTSGESFANKVMVVQTDETVVGIAVNDVWDVLYLRPAEIAPVPVGVQSASEEYLKGTAPYRERLLSLLDLPKLLSRGDLMVNQDV